MNEKSDIEKIAERVDALSKVVTKLADVALTEDQRRELVFELSDIRFSLSLRLR